MAPNDRRASSNLGIPALDLGGGTTAAATPEASEPPVSDATRYLCAGLYEDAAFDSRVIEMLLDDEHHAIGIAPSIDLPTVARHALAARRRVTTRQLIHTGLAVLAAIILLASEGRYDRDPYGPALIITGIAALLVTLGYRWSLAFGSTAAQLRRETFDPDPLKGDYRSDLRKRIDELALLQQSNAVIYSGFSPFVGSGIDLGGWSFTVDIEKGKEMHDGARMNVEAFDASELYTCLDRRLRELDIPGLQLADYAFVNGRDIRGDVRFLPDQFERPRTLLDDDELSACADDPTPHVRHYKCARIVDWGGELVLSVMFRVALRGPTLFTEACFFLLTPVKESYRQIDHHPIDPSFRQMAQMLISAAFIAPFEAVFAPLAIIGKIQESFERGKKEREERRAIREQPLYDFGARSTPRELAASGAYRRYFQKLDKEMYLKLVQRTVLDTLCDFLEDHGIDVSDLRDRQATIYNSGVMISGGTVTTESMTVGQRAKSIVRKAASTSAPAAATK